jgi:MFS superfamily sulfate permease-like transporter
MRRLTRFVPVLSWAPGVLIIRPDAPLFYANAQSLRDTVTEMVQASEHTIRTLILDLDANDELDITSSEALAKLTGELGRRRGLFDRGAQHLRDADHHDRPAPYRRWR